VAKEKATSVIDRIRSRLSKEGGGAGVGGGSMPEELFFVPKGGEKIVRFLSEFDEPVMVETHDWYGHFMPQPCFKYYGKKCPFHTKPYRTAEQYIWTLYDYENEAKRMIMMQASQNSALEDLLEIFDEHGTIGVPKEGSTGFDIKIKRQIRGNKTKYKARVVKETIGEEYQGKYKNRFKDEKVFSTIKGLIRQLKADAAVDVDDDDEKEEED